MNLMSWIGSGLAAVLCVYLIVALLLAERFK